MNPSLGDSAPSERYSRRRRRALGLSALAVVLMAAAGFAYLRSSNITTTPQSSGVPFTPPSTLNPVSYDFMTPSIGWAVVNVLVPSSAAGEYRVFRTVDGAKHWQRQFTGQGSSEGFGSIRVQFFVRMRGYMAIGVPSIGEQVYRTGDGGDSWQVVQLPSALCVVVTFSDADHGWALAQANPERGQLFKLYVTSDGGGTWQRLPDPPPDAYYLALRGAKEFWMGSLGPGPPHVYASTDGGSSWQRHDLPAPPGQMWGTGGNGTSVQLLPQMGVVANTWNGPTGGEGDAFASIDLGSTWRYVPLPTGQVAYQDASHWWLIRGSVLFKSSDAGQTWTPVTDSLPNWQFVPHVIDQQHAWAELTVVGGYGLAFSSDGGLHWKRANVPA